MKEFKGTPGEWLVSYRKDGWGVRVTNGEHHVVTFNGKRVKTGVDGICDMVAPKHASRKVADAHLIAAAPDLLAALQAAWTAMDRETACGSHLDTERHMARKAIAKALGEDYEA